MRRTPFTLLAVVVVASLGAGVLALIAHDHAPSEPEVRGFSVERDRGRGGDGKVIGRDKRNVTIGGDLDGLYPGATVDLDLRLTNPNNFAIRVVELTVEVGAASAECPSTALVVEPFTGSVEIPENGSSIHTLELTMATTAGDACQAATFPLDYTGIAEKANQGSDA